MTFENLPKDTITDIQIHENNIFLSSFDKSIKKYYNFELIDEINHTLPISKMIIHNQDLIFADIKGNISIAGKLILSDCGGIQGLCNFENSVIAGGWNRKIQILQNDQVQQTIFLNQKVFDMDIKDHLLLIGCDLSTYIFLDLRKPECIIKKKIRKPVCSVALNECAAIGTTEGKIKIDFNLLSNDQNNRDYVFNAHKSENTISKTWYPITSIILGHTLFSGGSDGRIIEFDYISKKSIREVISKPIPVSVIRNYENKIVAGFSDNFEKGILQYKETQVILIDK